MSGMPEKTQTHTQGSAPITRVTNGGKKRRRNSRKKKLVGRQNAYGQYVLAVNQIRESLGCPDYKKRMNWWPKRSHLHTNENQSCRARAHTNPFIPHWSFPGSRHRRTASRFINPYFVSGFFFRKKTRGKLEDLQCYSLMVYSTLL